MPHRQPPAEELAEQLDHLEDRGLSAAGDVVRLAGTSRFGRRDGRADRVVDVGEVAALEPVAEDLDLAVLAAASMNRVNAMSGRWRGPKTVK